MQTKSNGGVSSSPKEVTSLPKSTSDGEEITSSGNMPFYSLANDCWYEMINKIIFFFEMNITIFKTREMNC